MAFFVTSLLLLSTSPCFALPQSAPDGTSDPANPSTVYTPTPSTSTIAAANSAATSLSPFATDDATPIDAKKYFAVSNKCSSTHQTFYKTAYEGAVAIAYAATKWPQYGTDVSDLYFGKNAQNNAQAAADIPANLQRASEWNTGEFGFDDYMVLQCPQDDPTIDNRCNQKVGSDSRPIICYVTHTKSWGWDKDYVNCCNTFFLANDIEERAKANEGKIAPFDLRDFQNSGHLLLHEMMHAYRLTLDRSHLVDMTFDGSSGRRIYGPVDVAKSARIFGVSTTQFNADSYAQFANAMYWKDRLGSVPKPSVAPNPSNFIDGVSDNDNNYIDIVGPGASPPLVTTTLPTVGLDTLATPLATDQPSFVTGPVSSTPTQSPPKCSGLSSKKYIAQGDLASNIQDFCQQATAQGKQDPNSGSLGRTFNKGSMEEIDITITWPPGQPLPDCGDALNLTMNSCDGNDPANPMDWKGGGTVVSGDVTWSIQPTTLRQPPPTAPGGQCQVSGLQFNLWGVGYSSEDFGACLETNFNGCSGSGYSFNYGLGSDGREWTMNGWLGPGQGDCAHDVIVTCGGPSISCG